MILITVLTTTSSGIGYQGACTSQRATDDTYESRLANENWIVRRRAIQELSAEQRQNEVTVATLVTMLARNGAPGQHFLISQTLATFERPLVIDYLARAIKEYGAGENRDITPFAMSLVACGALRDESRELFLQVRGDTTLSNDTRQILRLTDELAGRSSETGGWNEINRCLSGPARLQNSACWILVSCKDTLALDSQLIPRLWQLAQESSNSQVPALIVLARRFPRELRKEYGSIALIRDSTALRAEQRATALAIGFAIAVATHDPLDCRLAIRLAACAEDDTPRVPHHTEVMACMVVAEFLCDEFVESELRACLEDTDLLTRCGALNILAFLGRKARRFENLVANRLTQERDQQSREIVEFALICLADPRTLRELQERGCFTGNENSASTTVEAILTAELRKENQ